MSETRVVGLVVHEERQQAAELARDVAAWLGAHGHEVRLPETDADNVGLADHGVEAAAFGVGLDLAISIGGDGTILRSIELVAAHDVPMFGMNVGQLGYLTEVDPAEWKVALERWEAGDSGIDERMLLDVRAESALDGTVVETMALNEAVLEKTPMGHTVRMEVFLDGDFFTTYAADGLIVATPTGSTAYSFSARGPIVDPQHRALLLTPVSPHMLFDRTLVLDPRKEVRLRVSGHRPATLSIDGRNLAELQEGDSVVCAEAGHSARFVTFGNRNFHSIVKAKFGLEDR